MISIITIFFILFIAYMVYFNVYFSNKVDMSRCFSRGIYQSLKYTNTMNKNNVKVDNIDNETDIDVYIKSNNYFTDKKFEQIKTQEELNRALEQLKGNEILIINEKRELDFSQYKYVKFGEYYVISW